ncbi:hypothetical protein GW17_00021815 [Ensete ventricosum]|nr:hypothetical protein GW17_00021815 [Ensete ventricosum]
MIEDNDVCLLWDRDNSVGPGDSGVNYAGSATTQDGGEGGYGSLGMVFASGAPPPSAPPIFSSVSIFVSKREAIRRGQSMSYSVWLGSIPAMGPGDFEVEPGTVTYNFPDDGWRGGLWLRTHCTTDNHGFFSCLTGDCGSEVQSCEGKPAKPPVTLLDFLNFSGNDTQYTYDVSQPRARLQRARHGVPAELLVPADGVPGRHQRHLPQRPPGEGLRREHHRLQQRLRRLPRPEAMLHQRLRQPRQVPTFVAGEGLHAGVPFGAHMDVRWQGLRTSTSPYAQRF